MNGMVFLSILKSNIFSYILSLFLSFLFIYPIFKLLKFHLFHPYVIELIFTVFANAVVIFLLITNECSINDFIYVALVEIIFWFAFSLFLNTKRDRFYVYKIKQEAKIMHLMFYFFFVFFLMITVYSYINFGIPLFLGSRVSLYVDSNGFGIIGRMQPMLKLFCLYYSFELIKNNSKFSSNMLFSIFVLLIFLIEGILGGGKANFMYFLVAYYFHAIKNNSQYLSKRGFLIVIALIFSTGTVGNYLRGSSFDEAITTLIFRFAASGDVYYYSLPDQLYSYIHIDNPLKFIFTGFLSPARLIDRTHLDIHTGNQLFYLMYPKLEGLMTGPNSRMPYLALVLFNRFLGIVVSFLFGSFLAIATNVSKLLFFGNKLFFPFYIYVITMLSVFIFDITLGMSYLFSIVVNIFIFLLTMIFSTLFIKA